MSRSVGVLAKSGSKEILETARTICAIIQKHGLDLIPDTSLASFHGLSGGRPLGKLRADLLVTVGGDGTVLKAVREMPNPQTPILSVNMGRRGYLTEVEPSHFEEALTHWVNGRFQVEKLWKLSVMFRHSVVSEGLNEGLLTPSVPAKMLSLDISLGRISFSARADGLIVATPTGSTAHAFSAGGPILDSSLDSFCLVLLAPLHAVRALVVPARQTFRVRIGDRGPDANLSVDGLLVRKVRAGDSVSFKKSSRTTSFIRLGHNFLQRSLRRLSLERETL